MEREIIESVVNIYNSITEDYNDEFFHYDTNSQYIDEFLNSINTKNAKILDAGCASGRDVKYMSEKGFKLTGVDLSEKFLELAKKQVPESEFMKMDITELEFPDNSFDGILDAYTFMHIPRVLSENVLNGYNRVLKKDGKLLILSSVGNGEEYLEEPLLPGAKLYHCHYTDEKMKALLTKCGFEIDYIKEGNMSNKYELSGLIQVVLATKR